MAEKYKYNTGLDVGTAFIVKSRQLLNGQVEFLSQRDAFLELEPVSELNRKMIQKSLDAKGAFYLFKDGKFYIVGQHAIDVATERQLNVDRPLKQGVLSARDKDSFGMLAKIIEILVGDPLVHGEKCVFSYPADPIDTNFDSIYHRKIVGSVLTNLGYTPIPILEAEALAYSELLEDGLTGIAISWGAGQTNVCVMHMGSNVLSFSVARGGDWIDRRVAEKLDHPDTIVQAEKEGGIELLNIDQDNDFHKYLGIYYEDLIEYVSFHLAKTFKNTRSMPKFRKPVKVVVSGGTSLAGGFVTKLGAILAQQKLPLELGDLTSALDPLTAVSNGCLIAAED